MKKIIILGTGLIGSTIAFDLTNDYLVTAVDSNSHRLKTFADKKTNTILADISSDSEIKKLIDGYDLVIGALPGFMGFKALKSIIEAGKNVVDISFFPEDPFLLDELAKEKGVTAVVDCGVSPGLSNIILGYHNQRMKIKNYKCIVGGLPYKREWPFQYKAYFSPIDVIEEYKRPVRIMMNKKIVQKEAMSDAEIINYKEVGDLEAFNTDGLRSLLKTVNIPNMIEKTLRYPGHIGLMKVFREIGYFDEKEIEVAGKTIKPIDVTARLIFPFWLPIEGEKDFTILDILIEGEEEGKNISHRHFIIDNYDTVTGTSSMARTTGFTCSAVARFFLDGKYQGKGICPPEYFGEDERGYNFVLSYLKGKGITINHSKSAN
ncbi:MAG: saccharopine dehydrogenase NADP-binding domain-containing protein [Ignavibacteriaceae bacterium]|nr:saccharopine dehydrogenase NADP-binding domain-containing protein [Ignavibacteriaceae bacterium]